MNQLNKILVPTDLSEHSRRALVYGCGLAAKEKATLIILHLACETNAWEVYPEEAFYAGIHTHTWPLDRVLAEATLDLNRFLEPHLADLKAPRFVMKRVLFGAGAVAQQINSVAEVESADLVIMSPRRSRGLRHWLNGGITDQVTRMSPCPVLSITPPLPSQLWRKKKVVDNLFSWPRQTAANL